MQLVERILHFRFVRYAGASFAATLADLTTLFTLLHFTAPVLLAAPAGYLCGMLVHWLVSSRKVFTEHVAAAGSARIWQQTLFALSALIGLIATTAIMAASEALAMDLRLAKLLAMTISFLCSWLLRLHIVFRPLPRDHAG